MSASPKLAPVGAGNALVKVKRVGPLENSRLVEWTVLREHNVVGNPRPCILLEPGDKVFTYGQDMFSVGFVLRLEEPNTGYIAQEQIKYIAGGPGRMFRGDPWGKVELSPEDPEDKGDPHVVAHELPTEVSGRLSPHMFRPAPVSRERVLRNLVHEMKGFTRRVLHDPNVGKDVLAAYAELVRATESANWAVQGDIDRVWDAVEKVITTCKADTEAREPITYAFDVLFLSKMHEMAREIRGD